MVFKNKNELLTFLYDKAYDALKNAQIVVYEIIQDFLQQFYDDYDPSLYSRTEQLLRSLVKGDIQPSAKGYVAEVYFDLDELQYSKYDWQGGNPPSGEQVFEAAKQGLHGAIGDAGGGYQFHYVDPRTKGGTGVNIWSDPLQVLDAEAIRILKDRLVEQGIPLKKK